MTWTGQTFSVGQILTAAQLNNLQADITAQANGDSGAPTNQTASYASGSVDQAAIGASAVGQGELKRATASGSTSVISAGTTVSLTGGSYSWWTGSAQTSADYIVFGNDNVGLGGIGLKVIGSGSVTFYRDEGYIQASPPYDLGDGEIQQFIFLMIDNNTNEIINIEVGKDPTWAYHGPTNIVPDKTTNGVKYKKLLTYNGKTFDELKGTPEYIGVIKGDIQPDETFIEITQEYKNRDIDLCPNPWFYNNADYFSGRTVIMLDPFSAPIQRLTDLHDQIHAREVRDIIAGGYLTIDNTPSNRKGPAGLMIPKFRWKNTV